MAKKAFLLFYKVLLKNEKKNNKKSKKKTHIQKKNEQFRVKNVINDVKEKGTVIIG